MLSCSTLEEGWGDILQTVASSVNENMKRTEHGKKKKKKKEKKKRFYYVVRSPQSPTVLS